MTKHPNLPAWADIVNDAIEFDPADAYGEALAVLGVDKPDQYWLEVARRCVTNRLKDIVKADLDLMNALASTGLRLKIRRNEAFALANHPPGAGAEAGVQQFRKYYQDYLARVARAAQPKG